MTLSNILDTIGDFLKGALMTIVSYLATVIYPITNYMEVIAIIASINIVAGLIADHGDWNFSKAFKAVKYLIGYLIVLLITSIVCERMYVPDSKRYEFVSWITWVMIYFYATNILRNWNLRQTDNRVISFLYWVLSFKIVDKIQFLGEFLKQEKSRKRKVREVK